MPASSLFLPSDNLKICRNHLIHHVIEAGFVSPAKPLTGLGWIAQQKIDFGGAEIARIDCNQDLPGAGVNPRFFDALPPPFNVPIDASKSLLDEFTDGMALAG